MEKVTINLIDENIIHAGSFSEANLRCGGGEARHPKKVKYVWNQQVWEGISIFTDKRLHLVDQIQSPVKVAWLMEPKAYDPRASIIKRTADEVFEVTERNPLLDIALELERIALNEDYFIERNLYPNVDFYSGMIYQALGFPVEMFPVLFAIPRTVGWLAQWDELLRDPEQRIARPRQIYVGSDVRDYIPIGERG